MVLLWIWVGVLMALAKSAASEKNCGYGSCNPIVAGKVNVHLVPHTHDDVGWLKTVDEYFYGSKKSITDVGVQYILDTVVEELKKDPSRKFIYVEMAFFWRWFRQQNDKVQEDVRKLVGEGRLEFINGGWSMNDEAATHYNAIIDQMTLGLRFLNDTFGRCGRPRVAWQIDPFGHSKEQANLFAKMGFDGLFFARLDYADHEKRLKDKTMEMLWETGSSDKSTSWPLGGVDESDRLFTGVLYDGYGPPAGFCYDDFCDDDPIMDDVRLKGYNVNQTVANFVKVALEQAKHMRTNHVMWTMGSDFNYVNALTWFKNMDKLIKYVRQLHPEVHVLYSTPSCYLKALNDQGLKWPIKEDDFFPYASDPHSYWTGYFTSRPTLKGMVRRGNNKLQVCKQLSAISRKESLLGKVQVLKEAMGILQHHDAVSGTAKQAVTDDYAERLHTGMGACDEVISEVLQSHHPRRQWQSCPMLNISQCSVTEDNGKFMVNVYNPLARQLAKKYIRLPVTSGTYKVFDMDQPGSNGGLLQSQIVPIHKAVLNIPGRASKATHQLVFVAESVPPLGTRSFRVEKVSDTGNFLKDKIMPKSTFFIGFDEVKLQLDSKGNLKKVIRPNGKNVIMDTGFAWYKGHDGDNHSPERRASGAYIFRPASSGATPPNPIKVALLEVYSGPLVQEVHRYFEECWVSDVLRVYPGSPDIEREWLVGPVPVEEDKTGKEVVALYSTDLKSGGLFYTDSNGRQTLQRQRDFRPTWTLNVTEPISGNYYPVDSRIFIKDKAATTQFTVLNDRSQGASSMRDGQIEVMVHRRLLFDDQFGVDEALNESAFGEGVVAMGKHWLQVRNVDEAARAHKLLAQSLFMDVDLTFSSIDDDGQEGMRTTSGQKQSLLLLKPFPDNVHLLTLELLDKNHVLLRLEHQFDENEDEELSKTVVLNLMEYFDPEVLPVEDLEELSLGANMNLSDLKRLPWESEYDNLVVSMAKRSATSASFSRQGMNNKYEIELAPMQIKTFLLSMTP